MDKRRYSSWTVTMIVFVLVALISCGGGGGGGVNGGGGSCDEGSLASPLNIGTVSTTLTHSGKVCAFGTSFYRFTTGSTSGAYSISLTNTTSDLSWTLFTDSGFNLLTSGCDNYTTPGANNESCLAALTGGTTYYLAVDEWDTIAATYTLTIGGGGGTPLAGGMLVGNWFGNLEDSYGALHTLKVTVNSDNTISSELVDGSATGIMHAISAIPGQTQLFDLAGSNGTEAGFFVDSSFTHAVFVNSDFDFGVLQKGATSLPTYTTSDTVGTWSGFEVRLDAYGSLIETYSSSVTITSYPTFTGSNKYGAINGGFSDFDATYGAFFGDTTSPISAYVGAFMSSDKGFAGAYVCDNTGYFPEDCSFTAWNKQ